MERKRKPQRSRPDIRFRNKVRLRTRAALLEQEEDFVAAHKGDSDQQLLEYVCRMSTMLGRTPNAGEIIGGPYIASRFQGWEAVVSAAKLPQPDRIPAFEERMIYKLEYKRQEALTRQAEAEEKRSAAALRRQKDAAGREAEQVRRERDAQWGELHREDTDEQLLAYVQDCAQRLGHTPTAQETEGAAFIAQRFGSWAVVLTVAGLPLPEGVKPPNPKTLKAYLHRRSGDCER